MRKFVCLTLCFFSFVMSFFVMPAFALDRDEITVGFVYNAELNEEGWSFSHEIARRFLDNLPHVKTLFAAEVSPKEAEKVMEDMVAKGAKIVFATSFGFMEAVGKLAKKYPDVYFMNTADFKIADDVTSYMGRMYQARYLAGIVAGSMSKDGKIGYVAAFPIAEVIRGINAFTLGVQTINPKAKVYVEWTKSWYDPAKEKAAAMILVEKGCDILAQHQDSSATQEVAEEVGIYSIGYHTNMASKAPNVHLTAPIWNWLPIYLNIIDKVKNDRWQHSANWYGIETNAVGLAPFNKKVPDEVRIAVEAARSRLMTEKNIVFSGPIKDQSGKVRVPKGKSLSDEELLTMDWLVEGVVVEN